MLLAFTCPKCGARLEIEAFNAGTRVPCPACGAPTEVPPATVGPGVTVGGFRIERQIGEGGMGRVFLARQLSMDRSVALKILPTAMAADPAVAERFISEVRLSAKLDHPNLVTAYEAGQDEGVLFFAMAYVNGPTLHEKLRTGGPLSELEALTITLKIARALAYAWSEHRLLHRDIKPANILMDARGEPKLADLGLAQSLKHQQDGAASPDAILGTPNYMSPEAIEGKPLDPRSDIYSLGATLWSMLTGQVPFDGEPPNAVLRKQLSEPLPPVTRWNPRVSADTQALLLAMLAKDPHRRIRSWEELIARIEELLLRQTMPRTAPPVWPLAILAVLLLIAVGAAALWAALRARSRPPASPVASPSLPTAGTAIPEITAPAAPTPDTRPPATAGSPRPVPPASAMLQAARAYWRDHPDDRQGAAERFREVARRYPDTPPARQALEQAMRIERLSSQNNAVENLLRQWSREADAAMERGDYDEIIRRWSAYSGPFAAETAHWRAVRVEAARAAKRERDRRTAELRQALDREIDEALGDLLRNDRDGALRRLRAALQDERFRRWKTDVEPLVESAADLPDRAARLAQSFRALGGQATDMELREGRLTDVTILAVNANGLSVRQWLPQGHADRSISWAQLSPREVWRRLGPDDDPSARMARGLLAAEHGEWALAAEQFEGVGTSLASRLAGIARRRAGAAAR